MADILSVRDFTKNMRRLTPGQSIIVVDAVRKKIILSFEVKRNPEMVEQNIRKIYQ